MQNVITNEEVIQLAFGDGEYVSPEVVCDADIDSAAFRYIIPIVGKELYKELLEGSHEMLRSAFVAPALAMSVRTMIQPALNVRTGQAGLSFSSSLRADSSTKAVITELHKSLKLRRQTLLKRLSSYVREHASEFPSYDVDRDIMQKCSISGGYVQGY